MRALPFLLLTLLVAACGQTGDLYLPQKTAPASAQPPDEEANRRKGQVPSPAEPSPEPAQQEVR